VIRTIESSESCSFSFSWVFDDLLFDAINKEQSFLCKLMDWHTIADRIATFYQKTQAEIMTVIEWASEQTFRKSKEVKFSHIVPFLLSSKNICILTPNVSKATNVIQFDKWMWKIWIVWCKGVWCLMMGEL
jgi:hypothetical protein